MSDLETLEFVKPMDIEKRSFAIIEAGLEERGHVPNPQTDPVLKRVIHTTADFDYAENLVFSENVVNLAAGALAAGATVVTDTSMAAAGINKRVLGSFGGTVRTFIADDDVATEARTRGITRSAVSMERASALEGPVVYAIGNAPTALVSLADLAERGALGNAALIIGVPVGFVNVVESKELVRALPIPHIVARGRKGGSNVAAAIVNALLYRASGNRRS